MCGIVGVWSDHGLGTWENVEQRLSTMMAMVSHRGPDGRGVWTDGVVGFGHARLAIIDLSDAAAQPMADAHDTVHITHNGEIYNYRELRKELSGPDHRFRTQSDTEVIIEGYKRWGIGVLERLRGMFAFAIWDAKARRLVLARDRVGKKPLYYCRHDGMLLFDVLPGLETGLGRHHHITGRFLPRLVMAGQDTAGWISEWINGMQ